MSSLFHRFQQKRFNPITFECCTVTGIRRRRYRKKLAVHKGQVNQRFLTEELLVPIQDSPSRFCSNHGDNGTGFSPGASFSL